MEGLKGELVDLKRERGEKEREMSRRKVRIEQAEKKVWGSLFFIPTSFSLS